MSPVAIIAIGVALVMSLAALIFAEMAHDELRSLRRDLSAEIKLRVKLEKRHNAYEIRVQNAEQRLSAQSARLRGQDLPMTADDLNRAARILANPTSILRVLEGGEQS